MAASCSWAEFAADNGANLGDFLDRGEVVEAGH